MRLYRLALSHPGTFTLVTSFRSRFTLSSMLSFTSSSGQKFVFADTVSGCRLPSHRLFVFSLRCLLQSLYFLVPFELCCLLGFEAGFHSSSGWPGIHSSLQTDLKLLLPQPLEHQRWDCRQDASLQGSCLYSFRLTGNSLRAAPRLDGLLVSSQQSWDEVLDRDFLNMVEDNCNMRSIANDSMFSFHK